jgi:preprotein translocase subunit SecG
MEININNYEEYVIDFIDGMLNEIDTANLLIFLDQNPVLKEEFEIIINSSKLIPIENNSFESSTLLKPININLNNYNEKLIALIENDLSQSEKEVLLSEIKRYPELKKAYELFLKTKLIPDSKILYNYKESLIKTPYRIITLNTKISGIAALFIAIIIFFYHANNYNTKKHLSNNVPIVSAKQDSFVNNLKSENKIHILLQQDSKKQILAFGGVNAALVRKNGKKSMVSPTIPLNKNNKSLSKENPLNNNSNQTVSPIPLPKKIFSDNGLIINNIAQLETPKLEEKQAVQENNVVTYLPDNNDINIQNVEINSIRNKDRSSLSNYVKQQLQITALSEIISVNKPINSSENITLAESIGLNVLSIYNMVSNHDLKVKKTYNNDGEIEKVSLVATGW